MGTLASCISLHEWRARMMQVGYSEYILAGTAAGSTVALVILAMLTHTAWLRRLIIGKHSPLLHTAPSIVPPLNTSPHHAQNA